MRHLHKNTLRVLYIVLALLLLVQPGLAVSGDGFQTAVFQPGEAAIAVTIESEGFLSTAYWDYGQYTIGYGTSYDEAFKLYPNNPKDENGRITLTEPQARELLKQAMNVRAAIVNNYLNRHRITVNQNQFDALLLFTYGVGEGWMTGKNSDGTSYMIRILLEETSPENWTKELVHEAFGAWNKAGGEVLEGLIRRRATEADLFLTPWDPNSPSTPSQPNEPSDPGNSSDPGEPDDENPFTDLDPDPNTWYIQYVLEANKLGIMTGRGNGIFGPDDNMTRAELVTSLSKYAKPDLTVYTQSRFTDVADNTWFMAPVEWAAEQKLVNGYGDGSFLPDGKITRERICNIIARYLRSQGVGAGEAGVMPFRDEASMAKDAIDDIYFCASLGIVNGRDDGTFDPTGEAKRSEVAKILTGMVKVLEAEKKSDETGTEPEEKASEESSEQETSTQQKTLPESAVIAPEEAPETNPETAAAVSGAAG